MNEYPGMDPFSYDTGVDNLETARKLFHESREGFLRLFDKSPVCMSMTTTTLGNRVYVRVNKRFIEIFGFQESEIIGRTSIEVGILDKEESIRVGSLIREKGRLQNDYVKCIAKNGKTVHTISSIEAMEMNGQELLVSFFINVTEIIEQQAVIERHAQELQAVNRELEAFSFMVSHDLRAPLRIINGYIKILEEDYSGVLDAEGKKLLTSVQKNALRMNALIDDLLKFARLGRKPLGKSDIDMNLMLEDVLAELSATNHRATIRLETLHPLYGDQSLIRQVMINLLSNGIKYSSRKEHPVISVSSVSENGRVIYSVSDNGAGFDMALAPKLFNVFQRLHKSSDFEGTGVGLAMVHRILERHGGSIEAKAQSGEGATFTFWLPSR